MERMKTEELVRKLDDIAEIGIVNYAHDVQVINEAARRLEELDKRMAIMSQGGVHIGDRSENELYKEPGKAAGSSADS